MQGRILEHIKPVSCFVPIDTTGAGQDGDWVNLKHFRKLVGIIQQGAWAGGTPAVTFQQASDNAGTGAKALDIEYYYQGTHGTDDAYAKTAISSDTFNLPNTANTITMVEIHAQDLDINNGFTHVRMRVASPGANADLISALYLLGGGDFAMKTEDMPSVIG